MWLTHVLSSLAMKMEIRHMILSNTSLESPSCLLHYYSLWKHCHLVVAGAMIN